MRGLHKVQLCASMLFIFLNVFSQAQHDSIKNITPQEEVIFEYDTVVLPPDTIHITDTITIIEASKKQVVTPNPGKKHFSFKDQTLSLMMSSFITGQHFTTAGIIDSVKYTSSQPLNYYLELKYGFDISHYTLFAGLNFTGFSEISEKSSVIRKDTIINGLQSIRTDSIDSKIKNYFYYAGFLVGFAYKINIQKFSINPELDFSINKILPTTNYKFGTNATTLLINKNEKYFTLMCLSVSIPVTYKINKKVAVFLKPTFNRNLNGSNLFPKTLEYYYGVGFGLKYYF